MKKQTIANDTAQEPTKMKGRIAGFTNSLWDRMHSYISPVGKFCFATVKRRRGSFRLAELRDYFGQSGG